MKKKVLLFYSKTGSGHLRAAEAIKEELEMQKKDVEVILSDGLEKANFGININPASGYVLLSNQFIRVFNAFYKLTNNQRGVKTLRSLIKKIWGKKLKEIVDRESPDLIISTHHHISPATISNYNSKSPFITIVTDLGYPHIIWFDKDVSRIITPTKAMESYANRIAPGRDERIIYIDYPLKNHYSSREYSGFSNTILVLGGGSGSGNIPDQVKVLLNHFPDKKIIVVCANNTSLFNKLKTVKSPNLELHGFLNNLIDLYNKSDIVISKAGPGTIVEAVTLRKPLIVTSWVGLQEKDNVNFVVDNKLGVYEPNFKALPKAIESVYKNYTDYTKGQSFFNNGTKKIVEYIKKEFLN